MSDRLDIILFGATGLTGKNCIKYLHKLTKTNSRSLTWGISGRSKKKLVQVLEECCESVKDVPIFVADINDGELLNKMTSSAKIIINCCGPYQLYGEPVVLACIETYTHYVDVSGEPYHMEYIFYKYNRLAKQRGLFIISSCGYDSIPTDLGIVFMQQNFQGILNSMEIFMWMYNKNDKTNIHINYATWQSVITGKENLENLRSLRKTIFKKPLPKVFPKLPSRPSLFKNNVTNTWTKRYTGCDRSVIYRTQRYFFEHKNARPVQVNVYDVVHSFVDIQFANFKANLANSFLNYNFGKKLALRYPNFFSDDNFVNTSPSDVAGNNAEFKVILCGRGWNKNAHLKNEKIFQLPNKNIIYELSGTNPAYGFTCVCVTLCAIVVLTETDNLPKEGGVYTPGVAFEKTSLMSQLIENGLVIKIGSNL